MGKKPTYTLIRIESCHKMLYRFSSQVADLFKTRRHRTSLVTAEPICPRGNILACSSFHEVGRVMLNTAVSVRVADLSLLHANCRHLRTQSPAYHFLKGVVLTGSSDLKPLLLQPPPIVRHQSIVFLRFAERTYYSNIV